MPVSTASMTSATATAPPGNPELWESEWERHDAARVQRILRKAERLKRSGWKPDSQRLRDQEDVDQFVSFLGRPDQREQWRIWRLVEERARLVDEEVKKEVDERLREKRREVKKAENSISELIKRAERMSKEARKTRPPPSVTDKTRRSQPPSRVSLQRKTCAEISKGTKTAISKATKTANKIEGSPTGQNAQPPKSTSASSNDDPMRSDFSSSKSTRPRNSNVLLVNARHNPRLTRERPAIVQLSRHVLQGVDIAPAQPNRHTAIQLVTRDASDDEPGEEEPREQSNVKEAVEVDASESFAREEDSAETERQINTSLVSSSESEDDRIANVDQKSRPLTSRPFSFAPKPPASLPFCPEDEEDTPKIGHGTLSSISDKLSTIIEDPVESLLERESEEHDHVPSFSSSQEGDSYRKSKNTRVGDAEDNQNKGVIGPIDTEENVRETLSDGVMTEQPSPKATERKEISCQTEQTDRLCHRGIGTSDYPTSTSRSDRSKAEDEPSHEDVGVNVRLSSTSSAAETSTTRRGKTRLEPWTSSSSQSSRDSTSSAASSITELSDGQIIVQLPSCRSEGEVTTLRGAHGVVLLGREREDDDEATLGRETGDDESSTLKSNLSQS